MKTSDFAILSQTIQNGDMVSEIYRLKDAITYDMGRFRREIILPVAKMKFVFGAIYKEKSLHVLVDKYNQKISNWDSELDKQTLITILKDLSAIYSALLSKDNLTLLN